MSLKTIMEQGIKSAEGNEEAQKLFKKFFKVASKDPLTGALSRRHIQEMPEKERRKSGKKGIGIILFDLDKFHNYNQKFGHLQGDMALKTVAKVVIKQVRGVDVIRYGGEEFLLLCYGANPEETAMIAERIRKAIQKTKIPENLSNKKGYEKVTITAGVSHLKKDETKKFWEKIKEADEKLLAGKEIKRNKVYS